MKCKCHTEIYSRVVGFFKPTGTWNKGKQEEFKDRKGFVFNRIPLEKIAKEK